MNDKRSVFTLNVENFLHLLRPQIIILKEIPDEYSYNKMVY